MDSCAKCHVVVATGARFCAFCGAEVGPPWADRAPHDPFIGQTFKGTYFIQQRIGGGGMGDVYKAMHLTLEVPVALKILKRALLADPATVERFHQEARAASRLRHRNVIAVTDFGQTEDGTLYMAMEYVSGKSLARVIADEQPLPEQRVVRIGEQILSALAEAHANQILHRDLKAENVMVESRRNEPDLVKVLDFGIAKLLTPGGRGATLTQAGLVCGTPGYMSPEQWSGEQLDARSDLYSVGVILYEMLAGELPYGASSPMETLRKQFTEKPTRPSERRSGKRVSADLEALVMRAVATDRDERPASADEMRAALLSCVLLPGGVADGGQAGAHRTVVLERGGPPPAPATPGSSAEARPAPRSRMGVWLAAAGCVVAAAAAITYLVTRPGSPPAPPATRVVRDGGSPVELATQAPRLDPAGAAKADARLAPAPAAQPRADAAPGPPRPEGISSRLQAEEGGARGAAQRAPVVRSSSRAGRGTDERIARNRPERRKRAEDAATARCSQLLLRQALGDPLSAKDLRVLKEECHK
jgi:hypothetical protein